jgi:serine O-acetyltransferase
MSKPINIFRADFARYYAYGDGAHLGRVLRCWCMPGLQATAVYRFGRWAAQRHPVLRLVADPVYHFCHLVMKLAWGIDVPRSADIGRGLYIGHFGGITVSGKALIGKNCNMSQGITIGVSGRGEGRGAPVIGDNVYIAPGARVIGQIRVGSNVKIGANAVIHDDLPDNAVAVLAPGYQIISFKGNPNPNQVA